MSAPFVLIGIPSFRGQPEREFVVSLSETQSALAASGIGYAMTMLAGDPYLPKVRNRIVSELLHNRPNVTDFLFLDDDIGWNPATKVAELINRPEDVVCGVYPKKQDPLTFPCTLDMVDGALVEKNGLYRAVLIPTGFLRVKRHVLEKMAAVSPRYYETSADGQQLLQWSIFEAKYVDPTLEALRKTDMDALSHTDAIAYLKRALGVVPPAEIGQWWGEDFWFAERWRDMGGEVWIDPEIAFTHRGSKAWGATFGDSIRATIKQKGSAS
jgi:hypothetical protein